jgi:hypothetical protein
MELEQQVLQAVNDTGSITDSGEFAQKLGSEHNAVVGVLRSLGAAEMIVVEVRSMPRCSSLNDKRATHKAAMCEALLYITCNHTLLRTCHTCHVCNGHSLTTVMLAAPQDIDHFKYVLTDEAQTYLTAGSPEAQVFHAVPADGITLAALKVGLLLWCAGHAAGIGQPSLQLAYDWLDLPELLSVLKRCQ